jgi:hypothetical protein
MVAAVPAAQPVRLGFRCALQMCDSGGLSRDVERTRISARLSGPRGGPRSGRNRPALGPRGPRELPFLPPRSGRRTRIGEARVDRRRGQGGSRVVEALTPSSIGAIRRLRRRRSDVRHFNDCRCSRAVGGRGPHAAAGRPARGLGGGGAGRREARDGSAAAGAEEAERSCASHLRAQTPQAASSAARGLSRGTFLLAGEGGGP